MPDAQSNYESARQKILRFSLPPSESAGSRYSESSEAAFRQQPQADLAADHERRRAALMSIVSGLDAEMVGSTPKMSESQESGEYFVEQGFAYSGSQDMNFAVAFPSRLEKGKDRDEDVRECEKGPRSSSCASALWVSAEEAMGEVPPRSQSVCHWNATSPSQSSYRGGLEAPVDEVKRRSSSSRQSTLSIPRRQSVADDTRLSPGIMDGGKRQSSPIRPPIPRPSTFEDKDTVRHPHRWGVYDDERLRRQQQQLSSPLTNATDHSSSFHSSAGNSSYSVAARERLAFGIPPSESDEVHLIPEVLSQTDSSLSLLEGGHWQEEWDTLSSGAESLFRQLSFEETVGYQRRSRQVLLEQVKRSSLTSSGSYRSSEDEGLPNDDASWRATQAFYGHAESPRQQGLQASPRHQEPQASPRYQELQASPGYQELQASPRHREPQASPQHQEPHASSRYQELQASPRYQELQASPRYQELPIPPRSYESPRPPPSPKPQQRATQDFYRHEEPQKSPRHQDPQALNQHQEPPLPSRKQELHASPRSYESPRPAPSPGALRAPRDDSTLPETARERVIQELRTTEETFVDRLQTCVRVFILPLRVQSSREWIVGVPANVSRLLDWFEDIVNLHLLILQALNTYRDRAWDLTKSLRAFIPRLEIYQPYLVRLADVTEEIVVSMADESSNFGEFVNIQERTRECRGWNFEEFLMEPVHRLAAYQDLFTRLLESTPTRDPCYISTFFLARSTDLVINVMKEVKTREDEYNLIKSLSIRIQGIPLDQLATRERRLLHSGILHLTTQDEHLQRAGAPETEPSPKPTNRASRLVNAIHEWVPKRSNSVKSTASSSTGTSAFSDLQIWPPGSPNWLPIPKRLGARNSSPETPIRTSPQSFPVQVFVFSDLVLLTIPLAQTPGQEPGYSLVSGARAFRPFSIARMQKDNTDGLPFFYIAYMVLMLSVDVLQVEAVSVEPSELNKEGLLANALLRSLEFSVPQASPTVCSSGTGKDVDRIQPWLSAFTRCSRFYLRSLSFPSRHEVQDYVYDSDEASDFKYTVSCLLSSGLPMPKSPSGQLSTNRMGSTEMDIKTVEREERGWWSLRFQQVLGELRRRDLFLSESVDL